MKRRDFLRCAIGGASVLPFIGCEPKGSLPDDNPDNPKPPAPLTPLAYSPIFWVHSIPDDPFVSAPNHHTGVDALIDLMAKNGLRFYRSSRKGPTLSKNGLIGTADIVLIKVNAQWKYRGCTNSDLVRGVIQRILSHPDGFTGEVVIIENGQGRGSLYCNNQAAYGSDKEVHANANDDNHSFIYLVNQVFQNPQVSAFLLDPIRTVFIDNDDHTTDGYRIFENVSYPCFTTRGGHRIELKEGVWTGTGYSPKLKLINIPVLKHHDKGGSEITGALKHVYGLVSMKDGQSPFRHYTGLGQTCGKMMSMVRTPVLNIMDAIWVCHSALRGFPESTTTRLNQIAASQDPVALDYWSAKNILYPIDKNERHHPDFAGIKTWLTNASTMINNKGGLFKPDDGLQIKNVTQAEADMRIYEQKL